MPRNKEQRKLFFFFLENPGYQYIKIKKEETLTWILKL